MVTIKQLRDHYVAMGGNPDDVDNMELNPQTVQFLSTFYRVSNGEGGGSGLPEVTDEDNGMGLIVSGGAWNKGALPIGLPAVTAADNNKSPRVVNGEWAVDANQFVVDFTLGDDAWSADKTFAEVAAAISAGKECIGKVENFDGNGSTAYGKLSVFATNTFATFSGGAIQTVGSDLKLLTISVALLANESVNCKIGMSDVTAVS